MGTVHSDRYLGLVRAALYELFGPAGTRSFGVRLWNGTQELAACSPSPFTVVIRRPGALRRMFLPPTELALAEAYIYDDIDIEGSLEAATTLADDLVQRLKSPARLWRLSRLLRALPAEDKLAHPSRAAHRPFRGQGRPESRGRTTRAIRYHYDTGNDFYALWLDRRMVYTCAYFPTGTETLDEAQEAKLEHICRKLRLQAGERLLDIGCGWGSLIQYAAQRYGVDATGVTLSEQQASFARQRITAAGIADRCRVVLRDYRDLSPAAPFDKIVSVGMYEAVGKQGVPIYFRQAHRLLKPGGLFLHHGISSSLHMAENRARRVVWGEGAFVQRYVFPDGYLATVPEVIETAERAGFDTRDVENLREHYARTLRHWVKRLEAAEDDVRRAAGETVYRVWRLYMSTAARGFALGRMSLIQALFAKPLADGTACVPPTRADLYAAR